MNRPISATVITCPGRLGDVAYRALEIGIEGVETPFHCVLALPAVTCKAIAGQVNPADLYDALAKAINDAKATVGVTN